MGRSAPRFSMRCTVSESFTPSERTRVVREPQRGVYDRETIYKILDEGLVCHVGFSADGQPFVIPTLYARIGDAIYFHGSAASRMLRGVSEGANVCLTVTLDRWNRAGALGVQPLDELSLALWRSAKPRSSMLRKKNSKRCALSRRKSCPGAGTTRANPMKKS